MSYQRLTEGDAYVIGSTDGEGNYFNCVSCSNHRTYREIINHLRTKHSDSLLALKRLLGEARIFGLDSSWKYSSWK